MGSLSLRLFAQHLETSSVSGIAAQVRFTWPPPPTISLRRLLAYVPFGGMVLSGGGTRTDFQVGAIRYILERGFDLWVVCGASGGSPNAAKIAEGEGSASLERYWRGLTSFRDIYGPSDWLSTLSNDPITETLAYYLFLSHSESLMGFVGGGIASALVKLVIESLLDLPVIVGVLSGLQTIVKLGIDFGTLADDINKIITEGVKSILTNDPIRIRLNGSGSNWLQLGWGLPGVFSAISQSVVLALDSRLEVFTVGSDTFIHRAHQTGIDIANPLTWTDWSLTPAVTTPSSIAVTAVRDGSGKIQVFRVGTDDQIYQAAESAPTAGAPLSAWTPLTTGHTQFKASFVAILDGANRVRLLGIGTDSAVYQADETAPGTAIYGEWTRIGQSTDLAISIRAGLNSDGRLEVFRVAPNNQVFHVAENTRGGAFGAWEQLNQVADTTPPAIDVTIDSAGFLQVCRSASDGNVYISRQLLQGFIYSSWIRLPRPQGAGLIKYGTDADGALQLFLIGADRTLYHARQEVPGGSWSSWFAVAPGLISFVASQGVALTQAFLTQEVFEVTTARNWNGQLEAFVRGHQLAPLHISHQAPLLDAPKVQASGIRLRMSVVSLESAKLRYADERAQFVDNPAEGQFSLGDAVVASGAVPGAFQPIKLIHDNYIDGGTRDLLPIKAAIDAGANSVISVVGAQPVILPANSFDNANMFDIASRGIADIIPNQILQDHLNPPVPWPVPARSVQVTDLPENHTVHGEVGIEPGLVAMSIDYGYMRAYDDMDPTPTALNGNPGPALHDNTNAIIDLRIDIWRMEHQINAQRQPNQDVTDAILSKVNGTPEINPVTDSTNLPQLRLMKWQLKALVDQRRLLLGGRVPSGVESWWLQWEEHSWVPVIATPWMAFTGVRGPNVDSAPWRHGPPRPLGDDNALIAEQSATVVAFIVFGGAKFLVNLPWKNFGWGDVNRVPDGGLEFDQTLATDGTVIREDGGITTYVTFGGAKFAIPGLPWPGAIPGASAGAVAGVNIIPGGSLNAIGNIPVNGTVLTTVDAAGQPQDSYLVWGGAKFLIPNAVLLDLNLSAQLGILHTGQTIPVSAIAQIPDIPRDGTVLKEIHGADAYLIQFGTKKLVVGPRRFFDLGLFWPDVGTLWDHALDAFPDSGLA